MKDDSLDLSIEEKRAVHRVVRAMHDGECPQCHKLFTSLRQDNGDELCPSCGFHVTKEEVDASMIEFSEHLKFREQKLSSKNPPSYEYPGSTMTAQSLAQLYLEK